MSTTQQSFILRIWLEETAEEASQATWRGSMTHVQSGTRRYVQELDDIGKFVAPFLTDMGVDLTKPEQTINQ